MRGAASLAASWLAAAAVLGCFGWALLEEERGIPNRPAPPSIPAEAPVAPEASAPALLTSQEVVDRLNEMDERSERYTPEQIAFIRRLRQGASP